MNAAFFFLSLKHNKCEILMEYLAKHTACVVYFLLVSLYFLSVESTQNTSDIMFRFCKTTLMLLVMQ